MACCWFWCIVRVTTLTNRKATRRESIDKMLVVFRGVPLPAARCGPECVLRRPCQAGSPKAGRLMAQAISSPCRKLHYPFDPLMTHWSCSMAAHSPPWTPVKVPAQPSPNYTLHSTPLFHQCGLRASLHAAAGLAAVAARNTPGPSRPAPLFPPPVSPLYGSWSPITSWPQLLLPWPWLPPWPS